MGKGDNPACGVSSPRAEKNLPARYSRHYYDIAMMVARPVKQEAFGDLDLLAAVVKHKQTFYASAWAKYPLAVPGTVLWEVLQL